MLKYLLNVGAKESCLKGTLEISQYGIQLLPRKCNLDCGFIITKVKQLCISSTKLAKILCQKLLLQK